MTIKELKEKIKDLPDHMDVFVAERKTNFTYGLVNSAQVKYMAFYENEGDDEPMAHDDALVLDEE